MSTYGADLMDAATRHCDGCGNVVEYVPAEAGERDNVYCQSCSDDIFGAPYWRD